MLLTHTHTHNTGTNKMKMKKEKKKTDTGCISVIQTLFEAYEMIRERNVQRIYIYIVQLPECVPVSQRVHCDCIPAEN